MTHNPNGVTPMRAVIYARYSSDNQREESIEDQVEVCRRYITAQGWTFMRSYTDAAISGASRFRPAFQALTGDAARRQFDVVVCEAVDRLGRRLADTADLQDTLSFHGIRLFTPGLGEITTMHVAIMGMMAQMALKDLGEKTKRGQLGRVLKGRSGGGLAYGYRITADSDPSARGGRAIVPDEAEIVRRIFREYAAGKSPEAIAKELNREKIAGPGGRQWSNTTIRGQTDRGTGLLNNAIYGGVLEWNRCSYVKDPRTGRRVARPNPRSDWEIVAVPELRIVDDELLHRVKARQDSIRKELTLARRDADPAASGRSIGLNDAHRVRFLLSGLLKCGCCGGGYTVIGKDRYGCATRRQKGTCANAATITRQEIEARVLMGLKERLLAPDLLKAFIDAFQAAIAEHGKKRLVEQADHTKQIAGIERKIAGILKAIEDGMYNPSMKQRMLALETEKAALLTVAPAPEASSLKVLTHPRLAELYRAKVEALEHALGPDSDREALEVIRSMIDRVELTPKTEGRGLDIVLHGAIANILAVCSEAKTKNPPGKPEGSQLSVVAGAGITAGSWREVLSKDDRAMVRAAGATSKAAADLLAFQRDDTQSGGDRLVCDEQEAAR